MSYIRKSYTLDQLRDYSLLFSKSRLKRFALKKDSELLDFCISSYDSRVFDEKKTYGAYYKYVYKVLLEHYANEYVYKNEFLNNYLFKKYRMRKMSLFSEFSIGSVIVDLALFNGESVGFEIKTELDSPKRLANQLYYYEKLFNKSYLIIPSIKKNEYESFFRGTNGIILYEGKSRSFELVKESEVRVSPDPYTLMEVLLTKEYRSIVQSYYGKDVLKNSTDFTQFEDCRKLIAKIRPYDLNRMFVDAMKRRKPDGLMRLPRYRELSQAIVSETDAHIFKENLLAGLSKNILL